MTAQTAQTPLIRRTSHKESELQPIRARGIQHVTSPRFHFRVCALVVALTVPMHGGKGASRDSKTRRVYEDSEVRIAIPTGWSIVPKDELSRNGGVGASLGNSVSGADGKVVLEKGDYVLGITYHTDHASGIEGGRFIEIFNIPWPHIEDPWTCSLYLRGSVYPANRILTFTSLVTTRTRWIPARSTRCTQSNGAL